MEGYDAIFNALIGSSGALISVIALHKSAPVKNSEKPCGSSSMEYHFLELEKCILYHEYPYWKKGSERGEHHGIHEGDE